MQLQRLLSYTRKAVDEYSMIQEGDHIAVGISGGKDSLTLLYALHGLKRFYPRKFDLSAVTVDLGFADFNLEPIQNLCRELEVPYKIVKSDIYDILFNVLLYIRGDLDVLQPEIVFFHLGKFVLL